MKKIYLLGKVHEAQKVLPGLDINSHNYSNNIKFQELPIYYVKFLCVVHVA
jgi:hypothetical protein